MQRLVKTLVLSFVLSGYADTQAAPPDKHHEVQISPGHTLKLWFKPKYGWRAKSYDQRYPGCTRQQEHRVYTADGVSMPDLLKNPNNLHWLCDPDDPGKKVLYMGQLGLAGGMPPSKRVMGQAKKDLSAIAVRATEQGKIDALRRALAQAEENADFDDVYEKVFGEASSEQADLAIFDLTVGEVQELPNYKEVVLGAGAEDRMVDVVQDVLVDPRAGDATVMKPAELVEALYSPVESAKHQAARELLKSRKYGAACSRVLPLTARLLYKRYTDGKDAEARGLHVFWHYVLSGPRELVGIHQVALNMRCMQACRADTKGVLAKLHKPILDDIASWTLAAWDVKTEQGLTPALLPVLQALCGTCSHVLSYEPLVKGVLSKLRKRKESLLQSGHVSSVFRTERGFEQQAETLRTIVRLFGVSWPLSVSEAILDYVLASCQHRSLKVREAAAQGLSKALAVGPRSEQSCKDITRGLIRLCRDSNAKVREAAAQGLSKVPESVRSEEAWQAILEALNGLCKHRDCEIRRLAARVLPKFLQAKFPDQIWKTTVISLAGLCRDKDSHVCHTAAGDLSKALEGTCPEEAWKARLELLTALCRDNHWNVRYAAAAACSKALQGACSGEVWKARVASITALCKDDHSNVRHAAAEALLKALKKCSKNDWRTIVGALIGLCEDQDGDDLSQELEGACSEKTWTARVAWLMVLCEDESYSIRKVAAQACSKALEGACSEKAWKARVELFKDLSKNQHWNVRKAATWALSEGLRGACSEQGWQNILQALRRLCKDDVALVRRAAAGGLSKALESVCSEQGSRAILESLQGLCRDQNWNVRCEAARGLSKALEGAYAEVSREAIVKTLRGLCKSSESEVREAAGLGLSKALQRVCSVQTWTGIVETLTSLCKDRDEEVRQAGIAGLSKSLERKCSEKAWKVRVATLTDLCQAEDDGVRRAAGLGLSKALASAYSEEGWQGIVGTLRHLCKDDSEAVRSAAAVGLAQALGGKCSQQVWKAILESLKGLCQDEDWNVRQAAATACLEPLKGNCSEQAWKGILEVLTDLCQDDDDDVRQAADQALVQAMDQQELLLRVLMDAELPSPTVIQAIAAYNRCLILPEQCDPEVSRRIEQALAQERQKRGWPEALLGVQNLPSVSLTEEDEDMPLACNQNT